ncbi:short-chain dehydrogenase/reductase [Streptomyces sp. LP05-1]|uniref:Short-chain dehydrogenase/reductase n=1 Tax=Streptomyces pyxinae TaxID=2970734 RepID=A0ABT2CKV2_9ACTN|nr:short-chain dehydrogenase/reductase [Streptomyces sp. LP05-1]MCS0638050.1 short-chain dehydrogenase/reductase [Streptomyces sp. LP05-1]
MARPPYSVHTRHTGRTGPAAPLRGRTAVVTGAARGIGAELARRLADRGARVALVGLEPEALDRVAAGLPAGRGRAYEADVTDDAALARAADRVRRELGPPALVVANAGMAAAEPLGRSDPAVWRRVVEVNVVGSAVTARTFLPDLLATRGYFLQLASTAAWSPAPLLSAYCASKAAVESLARTLRTEVAGRGVGVGVAYLGWTGTELITDPDDGGALRALRDRMPGPAGAVQPLAPAVERLVRGIERRSRTICSPPWLLAARAARPVLPLLVELRARRTLRELERAGSRALAPTGPLGPGGAAATGAGSGPGS